MTARTQVRGDAGQTDRADAASPAAFSGRWINLFACMIVQLVLFGTGSAMLPLLVPSWMSEFHSNSSYIQTLPTLVILTCGVLSPGLGSLIDRFPLGLIVGTGVGVLAAALVLTAQFAHNVPTLVLLFGLLTGIALALAGPVAGQSIVALWFPRQSGLAIGILLAGIGIGTMIFPPLISRFISLLGWRDLFLYLSVFCTAIALFAGLIIRRPPALDREAAASEGHAPHVPPVHMMTLKAGLKHPVLWYISIIFFLFHSVVNGVFFNIAIIGEDRGFTLEQSGLALGLLGGVLAIGKVAYGRLSDFYDPRRLLAAALAFTALTCIVFMQFRSFNAYLAATVLLGIGSAAMMPLMAMLIRHHFSVWDFPRALGIASFFFALGSLGTLVAAGSHDLFGSFFPYWILSLGLLGLALILSFRIGPRTASEPA